MRGGHTPLGPGGEFDRIRGIWRRLGERAAPAGDDCALVRLGDEQFAVGTDLSMEGVHFRAGWLRPHEIGWRAAAASLSDLAAMAAEPLGVLVSLAVSGEWPEEFVSDLMEGVGEAAAAAGAAVWGGDLIRGDRLAIDVVVVGRAPRPVRRAGARPGDGLWVTGALGGPQAALEAWERRAEPDAEARERFTRPVPRIREALWLRDRGARAMLDVSDGLLADAGHLAAASGVRCTIEAERAPVHRAADRPDQALVGGEEYELLVAMPPEGEAQLAAAFDAAFGEPLTRVGRVEQGDGVRLLRAGTPAEPPAGFEHF
jgi:thiamine-monophosphate kinase